jgi:predicted RNase H-like HicB family nuclease
MRFFIMIRPTDTGYSADVPDLPGCVAAARTFKKVRKLLTRAIELHLESMQQHGEQIPVPRDRLEFILEPDDDAAICTWVEVAIPETAPAP